MSHTTVKSQAGGKTSVDQDLRAYGLATPLVVSILYKTW